MMGRIPELILRLTLEQLERLITNVTHFFNESVLGDLEVKIT
jgi:hypothetical protein